MLRNLVANAVKFTSAGGRVAVSAVASGNDVAIAVHDDGVGIPPDRLPTLFEADQDRRTRGTRGESGTGLGLALCKSLVELHGRTLTAESAPGAGTTFRFSLPLARTPF